MWKKKFKKEIIAEKRNERERKRTGLQKRDKPSLISLFFIIRYLL